MKKTVKKKPGRPPGRKAPGRPVLSTRVPLAFYERLKQAAQFSTRTMSEELIHRATQTFERDNILGETRKTLAEAQHLKEEAIQAELARRYTQIHSPAGSYWMPKGAKPLQFSLTPEFQTVIDAAIDASVRKAFAAAKGEPK